MSLPAAKKGYGALFQTNLLHLKFYYIVLCFCIASLSCALCRNKRDWAFLAAAMALTVGADYFLILHDAHVPGVAIFCWVHVFYILRVVRCRTNIILTAVAVLVVVIGFSVINEHIFLLAGLYGGLFATNLVVHYRYRRTLGNGGLIFTGLLLFALCDLAVAASSIPNYLGIMPYLKRLYPLIWLFYLPSQTLLAFSAFRFKRSDIYGTP
jgi:hypothetical protein